MIITMREFFQYLSINETFRNRVNSVIARWYFNIAQSLFCCQWNTFLAKRWPSQSSDMLIGLGAKLAANSSHSPPISGNCPPYHWQAAEFRISELVWNVDPKPFARCPWYIYPNTTTENDRHQYIFRFSFLGNDCADDDDGDLCRPRVEPNSGTL